MAHPYRFDTNRTWLPLAFEIREAPQLPTQKFVCWYFRTNIWLKQWSWWMKFLRLLQWNCLVTQLQSAQSRKDSPAEPIFADSGCLAQGPSTSLSAPELLDMDIYLSHQATTLCFPNTFTVTIPLSSPQGWTAGFQRGWGGNVWEETRKPWDLMKRRDGWIMMDGCNISQCLSWRQSWRFMAGREGRQALRPMRSRMRQWRRFPKSQWNGMEFRSGGKFSVVCLDDSFTKKARYLMLVPGQHNRWKRGMWRSDRNS